MMTARLALPLVLGLAAGGCSDLFGPEVDGRLLSVDGGLIFLVREIHGFEFDQFGEPQMALYMVTDRAYPCRGYTIEGDVTRAGAVITVDIAGIREPLLCFQETEPAEAKTVLDVGPGTWTLRFVHEDRVAEHTVTIDDVAIDITGSGAGLAVSRFARFWRYPPNSFALGCDRAGGFPVVCEEMVDSVAATPGVTSFVFGESGAIPYPVSYSDAQFSWLVTYFHYPDRETWLAARTRASMVYARFRGVRYYLVDWRNEHVGSWP